MASSDEAPVDPTGVEVPEVGPRDGTDLRLRSDEEDEEEPPLDEDEDELVVGYIGISTEAVELEDDDGVDDDDDEGGLDDPLRCEEEVDDDDE
jgi:hypothetical protein